MSGRLTVVLVDEHPLVLETLQNRFAENPRFEVVATATHSDKAYFEIFDRLPDLVVMDLELPGRGSLDIADQVSSRLPATRLVFLTAFATDIFIELALRVNVGGFLLKSEPVARLMEGFERIANGQQVYSQTVLDRLHYDPQTKQYAVKSQSFFSSLTIRQIQVLRHLARGESVKEVARAMRLSERAIESHKYRIMQKMGIHDRVVLTRFAIREGLMPA